MSIVQDSIPNLIGGVSQQTDKLMFPNQVKTMNNCYPKPIDGLTRRPPMEFVKKLFHNGLTHNNFACHPVFKDNEQYYIILDGSGIKVYDFNGTAKTINGSVTRYVVSYTDSEGVTTTGYVSPSGSQGAYVASGVNIYTTARLKTKLVKPIDGDVKVPYTSFTYTGATEQSYNQSALLSYITTSNPQTDLDITTIGDNTFVTNKTVTAAMTSDLSPYASKFRESALIFVKQGSAGTDYTLTVKYGSTTKTITYTTSASLDNNTDKKTNNIATELYDKLRDELGTTNWKFSKNGSCILMYRTDYSEFAISATDSNANRDLYVFYDTAESISVLPTVAPNGYILKVIGENVNKEDDYYVQFETDNSSIGFGQGAWIECVAPRIKYKIDATKMPHVLRRESNGTFTFDVVDWTDRLVGDESSAPIPAFIGNTIREVSSYKGRISLLAGDTVCYSDVEDVFAFFRKTVLSELDSDPIEVASNRDLTDFQHTLAYNEAMYLFSKTSLYKLTGGDAFTNKTVSLNLAKEYQCSEKCKPIVAGSTAFFTFNNGNYSRVLEMYISDYVTEVREVTDAAPKFLLKDINKIVSNTSNNLLIFLSTANKNQLGLYSYYYNNSQKVQSAWHTWTFTDKIIDVVSKDNLLYILWQDTNSDVFLSKMDLSQLSNTGSLNFQIHLDNIYKYTFSVSDLNANDGAYHITKAYAGDVIITDSDGIQLDFTTTNTEYVVQTSSAYVYIGRAFTSQFKLGHIYVRQTTQTGSSKVRNGILMLKELAFSYANAGYFKVDVTPKYSTAIASQFIFSGMILGTDSTTFGVIPVSDGVFKVPIISKNEDVDIIVTNDSFLPSTFLNYDWIGDFSNRV